MLLALRSPQKQTARECCQGQRADKLIEGTLNKLTQKKVRESAGIPSMLIWYAGLRRHARRLIGRLSAGVRRLARPDDVGCDAMLAGDHSGLDGLARRSRHRWRRQPDQAIPRQPG
jgi:hypothetical protein